SPLRARPPRTHRRHSASLPARATTLLLQPRSLRTVLAPVNLPSGTFEQRFQPLQSVGYLALDFWVSLHETLGVGDVAQAFGWPPRRLRRRRQLQANEIGWDRDLEAHSAYPEGLGALDNRRCQFICGELNRRPLFSG